MWRLPIRFFSKVEIFISNLPAKFMPKDLANIMPAQAEYKLSKTYCFVSIPEENDIKSIIEKLNQTTINNSLLRAKINNSKPKIEITLPKTEQPNDKKTENHPKTLQAKGARFYQNKDHKTEYKKKNLTGFGAEEKKVVENTSEKDVKPEKKPIILGNKKQGIKLPKSTEFYERKNETKNRENDRRVEEIEIEEEFVETYHFRTDFRLKISR